MVDLHNRLRDHQDKLQGDLAFFRNWTFFMSDDYESQAGQLIPTGPFAGTLGAFKAGVALRTRYAKLRDVAIFRNHTNFWAADSPRVVDTARYFAAGFYGLDWKDDMANLHVVPETDDLGADTLTTGTTCTAYKSDPDGGRQKGLAKLEEWQNTYLPPTIQRFEEQNPGLNLSIQEAWTMQELCGFEVLARGNSPWCELFNHTEWESFAYARSLLHYYRSGPGNKYSAARAFPFINATTNLLSSGPFAGTLFFSFVHDGDINPLLTFLDVFPNLPSPPAPFATTTSPNQTNLNNTWDSSTLTPMGARLTLERLSCPAVYCRSNAPLYPNHVYCDKAVEEKYVRVLVNDGVTAVPGCDGGPGKSCPLGEFEKRVMLRGWEVGDFGRVCGLEEGREKKVRFLHQ